MTRTTAREPSPRPARPLHATPFEPDGAALQRAAVESDAVVSAGGWWVSWESVLSWEMLPASEDHGAELVEVMVVHDTEARSHHPLQGLLEAFINIGVQAPDDVKYAEETAAFVLGWGPLDLCPHLLPSAHCRADRYVFETAMPVSAVGFYVTLFRELLAAGLQASRTPGLRFSAAAHPHTAHLLLTLQRYADMGELDLWPVRDAISRVLSGLVSWAETHPRIAWGPTKDARPALEPAARSPMIASLALQTVEAIATPDSFRECTGCSRMIDMRLRRRPTPASQNAWCDQCRKAGKAKRRSERILRERRRNARRRGT